MTLPATVRVKLSSEDAGAITVTSVVVREMPLRELVEFVLASVGKRPDRIGEILRNGSIVSGASRLRWQGWEADSGGLAELLATFPDPEPARPFTGSRCVSAVLTGPYARIPMLKEAADRRRLFRRRSFWDQLLELARDHASYLDYSYREQADCYRAPLDRDLIARLRAASSLLTYTALARHIEAAALESADFFVRR